VKNAEGRNDVQQSEKQKNPSSFSASFSARPFLCQGYARRHSFSTGMNHLSPLKKTITEPKIRHVFWS